MTTPPKSPFDFAHILSVGNKAATEAIRKEVIDSGRVEARRLADTGVTEARKVAESGINLAKGLKFSDLRRGVEGLLDVPQYSTVKNTTTKADAPKADAPKSTPTPAEATEPVAPVETDPVVTIVAEKVGEPVIKTPVEETVVADEKTAATEKVTEQVNASIDSLYEIGTKLDPKDQEKLVSAVMSIIRVTSGNEFTGEHVRWLGRLYGNKEI